MELEYSSQRMKVKLNFTELVEVVRGLGETNEKMSQCPII